MKIIRWDHYDYDAENNTQKEYRELDDPNPQETYMNLCEEIRKHGYKFDGPYHQTGKMGTPVVEGDLYMTFSYRAWGGVMADAWSCVDKVAYHYMDFYMMDQYSDEFKTPEYDLPGFVRPERPPVTNPIDHLQRLSITVACAEVCNLIPDFQKTVDDIKGIARSRRGRIFDTTVLNMKLKLNALESQVIKLQDYCNELIEIQNDFYKNNPQYDPDKIVTLTAKDGNKSVRVYEPYGKMTYEEVMEKFPTGTCTDNQLEQVFPDWNRFSSAFERRD